MDSQAKRTILAAVACFVVLFGWMKLQEIWYPPVPADETATPAATHAPVSTAPAASMVALDDQPDTSKPATSSRFTVAPVTPAEPVVLGDDRFDDSRTGFRNPYEFAVTVSPRGASVPSIRLSRYRNHVPKDRKNPPHDPYDLVQRVEESSDDRRLDSFSTLSVFLVEDNETIPLDDVDWTLEKVTDDQSVSAALSATVLKNDRPLLRLSKRFRVAKGSMHLEGELTIENLGDVPRRVVVRQRGPIGFKNEDPQRESRRIATAMLAKDTSTAAPAGAQTKHVLPIVDGEHPMRADVLKHPDYSLELAPADRQFLWTAVGNKYFVCILYWRPTDESKSPGAEYLAKVVARAYLDSPEITHDLNQLSDLTIEQSLAPPHPLAPGQSFAMRYDVYCGSKSERVFESLPPEFTRREYHRVSDPDRAGCTFQVITVAMIWLLDNLYKVVGNYGVAIIILVIIVRLILHPITKSGQVRMMRTQKAMAAVKPKIDALQEQYKNDRAKLNEEMMKLYREEGVNPASSLIGCMPMMLQLPIWAALWTSLNTNVDLRHQPFFWWIRDLSIPDGLWTPADPLNLMIPIVSLMTGPIHGFNLLPIIMSITMYAQQKFMQKLTRPPTPAAPKLDAQGRPLPDPMAQQQKMMNFMMIFFGLMLYNVPAGLNLYILCSSLLGMLEQYRIKAHIREQEEAGKFIPRPRDAKPSKPSFIERMQKRAELMRQESAGGRRDKKPRKQPRF